MDRTMSSLTIFLLVVVPLLSFSAVIPGIYAYSQQNPTDKNTLNVKIETDPEEPRPGGETRLNIEFINPQTEKIQEHVDYAIKIENNGDEIFGPIPLTHLDSGSVSIPVMLQEGTNVVTVTVEGIQFEPIPKETAIFDIVVEDQTGSPSVAASPEEEEGEQESDSFYVAEWNSPFSLHLGQTAQTPLHDIQVTFSKVIEDSRCPSDAQCVWEGNVKIRLDILKEERRLKSIDFSLGADDITRMYLLDKFYLELIEIEPYPTSSSHEILPSDYSAVFVVEPKMDDKERDGKESSSSSSVIPQQFKNHAALWTEGQIDDDSFVQGMESLIKDRIISVPSSYTVSDSEDIITREIPQWVKNNVGWWLQGLISDDVFLQNIEYLVENEIIVVMVSS